MPARLLKSERVVFLNADCKVGNGQGNATPQKQRRKGKREPSLLTARNEGMINSFNPVQLSAWLADLDMQYVVSRLIVLLHQVSHQE